MLIALLVFCIAITSLTQFTQQSINNNVEQIQALTDEITQKISVTDIQVTNIPILISVSVINIMQMLVFELPKLISNILSNVANVLPIPSWFTAIFITIVTVYLVFELISAVMRWKL